MKRIYYLITVAVLALASSCQDPQYIEPTAERQGITSLTAYFTTGKYVDQQLAKLDVTDENMDYFLIEIPYFFPEETEDPTTIYLSALRIRAELAPNCSIDPPLTVLDLSPGNEHKFTFTNNRGESREITIAAKRTKFRRTDVMTFNLDGTFPCEGFVDNEQRKIYLFTNDDLSGYTAKAVVCPHAKIKDLANFEKPKDYNQPQKFTVIAHDEVTETEYTITRDKLFFSLSLFSLGGKLENQKKESYTRRSKLPGLHRIYPPCRLYRTGVYYLSGTSGSRCGRV